MVASSKRVGLDKALFQIQQAVERAKTGEKGSVEDERVVRKLKALLAGGESIDDSLNEEYRNGNDMSRDGAEPDEIDDIVTHHTPLSGDGQAIESAESPLQLLAASHRTSGRRLATDQAKDSSKLGSFFAAAQANLDVGDDVDPISLGLVSEEEAESLVTL